MCTPSLKICAPRTSLSTKQTNKKAHQSSPLIIKYRLTGMLCSHWDLGFGHWVQRQESHDCSSVRVPVPCVSGSLPQSLLSVQAAGSNRRLHGPSNSLLSWPPPLPGWRLLVPFADSPFASVRLPTAVAVLLTCCVTAQRCLWPLRLSVCERRSESRDYDSPIPAGRPSYAVPYRTVVCSL